MKKVFFLTEFQTTLYCHLSFSKYYKTSLDPSKSSLWVNSRGVLLAVPVLGSENAKLSFSFSCCPNCWAAGLVEPPDPCPHQLPWQCKAPPGLLLVPGVVPTTALETHPQPKPPATAHGPDAKCCLLLCIFPFGLCFFLCRIFPIRDSFSAV